MARLKTVAATALVTLVADFFIVETQPGIFGVPLADSIRYANVAISLQNESGESFIYGYVPIVVAKCGVFLKEKGAQPSSHISSPNITS